MTTKRKPKVGERVAFTYHGKPRVGTVENKTRQYMTLEHFDTKTGREFSNFRFDRIDNQSEKATGITKL